MEGLEKTERAITKTNHRHRQHWVQDVERREKKQTAKKTKMTNTNTTKTC